jgi:hypothetical protein
MHAHTRAICKVHGLTLLLWVRTLWRCSDGLSFEVPPLVSNALLTELHLLLENVLHTVDHFKISCLGAPLSWLDKPRNCMGQARSELNSVFSLEKVDWQNPIRTSSIQSTSHPMQFLGFSNHEKGALRQEISKWSTVCSTLLRSGWNVVRSAPLAKGGTLKKRPSLHLHKVPTQSNKVSPRTFQTGPSHTSGGGGNSLGVKLNMVLHLVLRKRMCGAIPPSPICLHDVMLR